MIWKYVDARCLTVWSLSPPSQLGVDRESQTVELEGPADLCLWSFGNRVLSGLGLFGFQVPLNSQKESFQVSVFKILGQGF